MHVRHAMAAIQAGMCEVALVAYGSTQLSDGSRKVGGAPEDMRMPRGQFITPYGQLSPIGYYAMVAQLHMQRYGTTHRDLAEVAVAARKWAQLNPHAYRREDTSIDEVMASRLIADPLRQRDCCLVTDAGGAFILTTAERARSLRRPPVHVLGIAESFSHHYTPFNTSDWLDTNVAATADAALAMAGVTRQDIDVVQIYDHFTIGVIQSLEELGFCERGEGGAFVAGGRLAPGGDFPINTSGGGLSYNHRAVRHAAAARSGAPAAQGMRRAATAQGRAGAGARARPGVFLQYHPDSRSLTMETVQRPLPQPTRITQPYWDAAREGRLVIQECAHCKTRQFFPREFCTACLSGNMGWIECSGKGAVYTYTINRRGAGAAFGERVPYVVAAIDLDEGVRMMANIVDSPPEAVRIGSRVRVCFERVSDDIALPQFTLDG